MSKISPPFLIIISSPSGAGKSTICQMLTGRNSNIKLSISATTRTKRSNEIEGKDYYFVTDNEFKSLYSQNQFLESANIFGNKYGTPKKMIEDEFNKNNNVLFDIDWQGARQLNTKFNKDKILSFFLLPPSIKELSNRLKNRASDSVEVVNKRMSGAINEISHFNEYDHVIINDNLDHTYNTIINLIKNPNLNVENNFSNISDFVEKLNQEWQLNFNKNV